MRMVRLLLLALTLVSLCLADIDNSSGGNNKGLLALSRPPATRGSRFAPISAECRNFQAPRLVNGDYATLAADVEDEVVIDLIVGTDGRVQNPMIVAGAHHSARALFDSMGAWRYRPAMCDGMPIDSEGQIKLTAGSKTAAGTR